MVWPEGQASQGSRGGAEQEGLLVWTSLPWPGPCYGLSAVVPRQSSRLRRAPWYTRPEDRQRLQRCVRATARQALTAAPQPPAHDSSTGVTGTWKKWCWEMGGLAKVQVQGH